MKELLENYKNAQIELGNFVAKNILSETGTLAKIKKTTSIGYIADLYAEIEGLEVCLTIAKDFICYHEKDGVILRFSPEIEKEIIRYVKSRLKSNLKKEDIKKRISDLQKELKAMEDKEL